MSMATKAGVGMSRHHNPNVAGREAAEQALEKAGVDRPDFVFMFGSLGYDQRSLVRTVREAIGGAPLSGCSAEGTIDGDDADESGFSVVVTAISSDELRWHNGSAKGLEADPRAVGKRVAHDLLPHLSTDTIGLFVFPDGVKDFVVPTENLVDIFFGGWKKISRASDSSQCGAVELTPASIIWRRQHRGNVPELGGEYVERPGSLPSRRQDGDRNRWRTRSWPLHG
jgi:hypothetical protein